MNIEIPITFSTNLLNNITSQLSDAGTLLLFVLLIFIPLVFYIIHETIDLFPKDDKNSPPPTGPHYGIYDKKTGAFKRLEKIK